MGDAVVAALVNEVVGRLSSKVLQEFGLLWGFKDDISTLRKDFTEIQVVLQDAEEKLINEKVVDLWLKRLRSASLQVENVLDEISTQALLRRLHKEQGIKRNRVRAFFSRVKFRVRAVHKVKHLKQELDVINSKASQLNLTRSAIGHVDVDVSCKMPNRETSSLVGESLHILGRNKEIDVVIENICNKDIGRLDDGEIRVYSICGMGGMGKTTLAQLVYNHERVNQYFELKCWLYVSENFKVKQIIKNIMESIDKSACELTQLGSLQDALQDKLREKKFLIVLDDVWVEEKEKAEWLKLSTTLSCGAEGSIVVMTTRYHTTSRMMSKVPELQYNLQCLSENESWSLFEKHAFAEGREGDDISLLEPIGRQIVKKCEGLPLAVKTLGSLMWWERSTNDWERVKGSNVWELQENNILPALKLSYDKLLPHLKRCFAYCCLFPKGYEINKDLVIHLWVANGFIPPRGEINLYVLGEEIFNCLIWRSFFQVVKIDQIFYIKMHDLMHDMAQHVMGDDCLVLDYQGKEVKVPNEVLHLSSPRPEIFFSPKDLRNLTSLRSILMLGDKIDESGIDQIFNHVYLRALCLPNLTTLSKSICKLKHLRYLNLSYSRFEVLPDSIMYLQNLQVLLLRYCWMLQNLPEGLRYMKNLQHLDLYWCRSLKHLPLGIKELTNLRRLSKYPVGKESGAKLGELSDLNLLEGELKITQLENAGDLCDVNSAKLNCKTNMSFLTLRWSEPFNRESKGEMSAYDEKVLEGLEPNPNLKALTIDSYMGKVISPSWMVSLSNLVNISLSYCLECEHIPTIGRLPNLRFLTMERMDSLKCFYDDDKNMSGDTTKMFPYLQELKIFRCESLVSLRGNFPKLEVLEILECDELVSLPGNLPNIRKLHLGNCTRLSCLPYEFLEDLNELKIFECPRLIERYEEEMSVDWPKIFHNPNIQFSFSSGMHLGRENTDE